MLELGKRQTLTIIRKVDFGVYLGESAQADKSEQVLLPAKQVPEDALPGDQLDVFLYKDSQDRLIATTREPLCELGKLAVLKVSQVTRIGAFLDWGLEKDLFLPYSEQTKKVKAEDEVLVSVYVDKSGRLCATMKVYPYLSQRPPYQIGDMVKGRIYEIIEKFGVYIAVDDKYSAMIPAREMMGKYQVGDILEVRVAEIKEDGKLTVSDRQKAYLQLGEDAEAVMTLIEDCGGVLPFDDKASPETIREEAGLSKNAFKRAVGHLMKDNRVEIRDGKIWKILE